MVWGFDSCTGNHHFDGLLCAILRSSCQFCSPGWDQDFFLIRLELLHYELLHQRYPSQHYFQLLKYHLFYVVYFCSGFCDVVSFVCWIHYRWRHGLPSSTLWSLALIAARQLPSLWTILPAILDHLASLVRPCWDQDFLRRLGAATLRMEPHQSTVHYYFQSSTCHLPLRILLQSLWCNFVCHWFIINMDIVFPSSFISEAW